MKTLRIKNIAVVMAFLAFVCCIMMIAGSDRAYAAYKYKVTIYSGLQGTINGKTVWSKEYNQDEPVDISLDEIGFKEKKNSKYYVRGLKIAGHDNNENETTGFSDLSFDATCDVEYMVTYGIKGALVKYIARYVDTHGKEIHKSSTYYGMAGDKPVVSFRYIDGWTPDHYNIAKTLSEDESKNIMTFTYTKEGEATAQDQNDNNNNGNNGNQNTTVVRRPTAIAPGTAQNPAGTNVSDTPDNTTNIDDGNTPTTNPGENGNDNKQYTDLDPQKTPTASPLGGNMLLIGSIAGLVVLLALVLFLLKRKKNGEETDE